MNTHELSYRIKSARRKKRLAIKDRDKQLIQLDKRSRELWHQKRHLPLVPLEQPYQRGWKRFFVLRVNAKYGVKADFYEAVLAKINTVVHHHDKMFKRKKRRKWRYGYEVEQQSLREFDTYSWNANRVGLTEEEKACFIRIEIFDVRTRCVDVKYVFAEPWRYVLKIKPHIVTHIRLIDVDIERELAYIEGYIANHMLSPRINLLTRGKRYNYKRSFERLRYINKIKNIPRNSRKEAYLDLET